ncbi:MAG: phosphoribosyltransferase [Actinobacteria bacterium]|nr:phosphoribosyltransferase [Actinomycetota bacterium]
MIFRDRRDAGERLAAALDDLRSREDVVVAGLVRGGVPVAAEVAASVGAPLEVLVVRKVGAPTNPEYGIGAVAEGGLVVANPRALELTGVSDEGFQELARAEAVEVQRRVERYRAGRPRASFEGKAVVIVDDGLATGVTAHAGIEAARRMGARQVILAVPVGSAETVQDLGLVADRVVCLEQPPDFRAVGTWYQNFAQVSDAEVVIALAPRGGAGGQSSEG